MKINFKELPIYTGISKKEKVIGDARESFADILYTRVDGIRSKSLAMKIFESDGEIDLSPEDLEIVKKVMYNFCTPAFIDAIEEQINQEDEK